MPKYRVSFILQVNEDAGHPRKWVPDAIVDNLEPGEDVLDWAYVEVDESVISLDSTAE